MGILSYYVDGMLRCPNCGAEACITEEHFNDCDIWYRPECSCCNINWSENYPTIEEAVKAWNSNRVEMKPVVHGRWVWTVTGQEDWEQNWHCSECDDYSFIKFDYCPNCGATMDLKEEETE